MDKGKEIELEKKIDRILSYLHNDEDTGEKGLVADFSDYKKKFDDFVIKYELEQKLKKEEQNMKKARLSFWGALGGSIVTGAIFVFKWLIGDTN